jgi:hypothetical protein
MTSRDTDTRAVTLVDVPLVKRLAEKGVVLDSELEFTRDAHGPHDAVLSSILLPQRGLYTLVARSDKQHVVGQFRLRSDEHYAHIVYVAPRLDYNADDTAWLHIFDAMAREAGKHGAHGLIADVDEDAHLFESMRTAGFAVYARQQIWRRRPGFYPAVDHTVRLDKQTDADIPGIHALYANTVPSMVQQIAIDPALYDGLVYRKQGRIAGYMAVSEGRHGVYVVPYLHPDIVLEAAAIFDAALNTISSTEKVPTYMCVSRHQSWIASSLEYLGFEPGPRQAVMVRHITAGIRYARFSPVELGLRAVTNVKAPHKCQRTTEED